MSADREVVAGKSAVPAEETGVPAQVPLPLPPPAPAEAGSAATVPAPTTSAIDPHGEATHAPCGNCGAALNGHYCWNCGQPAENPVHSLWHFIGEATEDLTHADSRLWRTLGALLFKPGFLTTEFLAGRRVRYLPPIRLYLVMSLVLFLFLSLSPTNININTRGLTQAEKEKIYRETGHKLPTDGFLVLHPGEEPSADTRAKCARIGARPDPKRQAGVFRSALESVEHKACLSLAEDKGHALGEAFMHTLPKALFITLPIMAGLMKLLYRRPERYYVEHLLVLLHNYAFVFLWFSIVILLGWIIRVETVVEPLTNVMSLYPLYYFFSGMRRVYAGSVGSTVVKFTLLSFAYLVVAVLTLLAVSIYSVLVL